MKFFNTLLLTLIVIIFAAACGNLPEEGQNITIGDNTQNNPDLVQNLPGPYIGDGDSQNYSYMATLKTLDAYAQGTKGHSMLSNYFGNNDPYYARNHNNFFDWTQEDFLHGYAENNIQIIPSNGINATKGSVRFPHSYHQDIARYTDLIGNCTTNCHTRFKEKDTKPFQVSPGSAGNPTGSKIVFSQKVQVGDSTYKNPAHNFCWTCHANLPTPTRAPHGLIVTKDGVTHQPNGTCSTCHFYNVGDIVEPTPDPRPVADRNTYEPQRENHFNNKAPLP